MESNDIVQQGAPESLNETDITGPVDTPEESSTKPTEPQENYQGGIGQVGTEMACEDNSSPHVQEASISHAGVKVADDAGDQEEDFSDLPYSSRAEAISMAFDSIDANQNGSLERNELRALVPLISPQQNRAETAVLLRRLDINSDGSISRGEWEQELSHLTAPLDLHAFNTALIPIIEKGAASLDREIRSPEHRWPENCIGYLDEVSGDLLRRGLAALIQHMATEHLKVTSKSQWDVDGYLPIGYQPDRPLRWLGQWLHAHNSFVEEVEDPRSFDWSSGIPWDKLTKHQKLQIVFMHLDKDNSGYLDLVEVTGLVTKFGDIVACGGAEKLMFEMDLDSNGQIDYIEFEEYCTAVFENEDDSTFDEKLHPLLDAYYLSTKDRNSKFEITFTRLMSQGGEGGDKTVDWHILMELGRQLCSSMPNQECIELLGKLSSPEGRSSASQVIEALTVLCNGMSDDKVADVLAYLLSGAVELDSTNGLQPEFKAHVQKLPFFGMAPSVSVSRAKGMMEADGISETICLDCRTADEYSVSTIMDGMHVNMLQNPGSVTGWEADTESLLDAVQAVKDSQELHPDENPLVFVFCTDGLRSLPVALKLCDELPGAPVVHLCGGMIAWFNAGELVDDYDGMPTECIHPFENHLEPFVTRPNMFEG